MFIDKLHSIFSYQLQIIMNFDYNISVNNCLINGKDVHLSLIRRFDTYQYTWVTIL